MFTTALCKTHRRKAEGFTLIEVLVTLAMVSTILVSIGALMGVNARSARAVGEHNALVSIARVVESGLPDAIPSTRTLTGNVDAYRWQADFRPFSGLTASASQPSAWIPEEISITVMAPSGRKFQLETVRLLRSAER